MSVPDAELVLRVRAGDVAAFGDLIARHRPRLGRYAFHLLGNREEAEEALQDALLRAWRSIAACDPDRFGAWVLRILVNRCRSRLVRHDPFQRDSEAALAYDRAPAPRDPDIEWDEEIRRALARLPLDQREAFLLKYVEELSYEDMSALTGAGESALKMRVKRACDHLRELLQDAWHG